MGLFFPPDRWLDLTRKLQAAAPAFGCGDAETCARLLATSTVSKKQIELLATYLTVGETYFFREPRTFAMLEQEILPTLMYQRRSSDRRLRFWSAACCTGEEPYSIAMLLHRLLPDLSTWKTNILATDISPRFLRKATEGVYGQWSFRSVPATIQAQYFRRTAGGLHAISPALKTMVHFAQLNLAEDCYPSSTNNTDGMDVIFCRNVLIYFTAERIKHILTQLHHALNDGGWLVVSPVETAFVMDSPFTVVQFPGVTFFRKSPSRQAAFSTVSPSSPFALLERSPAISSSVVYAEQQTDADAIPPSSLESEPYLENRRRDDHPTAPPPDEQWRRLYEEACAFYTRGQYADVVNTLRTIQWEEGDRSLSSSPSREQILALLARAHANQGRLTEAQTWCEQALSLNKFDPGLYYLHATILLECGQESEARSSLTQALYLDQRFVLAHFTLGNLARQRREFQEAEKHWEKALTLLQRYRPEELLPESEGMTAGRLAQIITHMSDRG